MKTLQKSFFLSMAMCLLIPGLSKAQVYSVAETNSASAACMGCGVSTPMGAVGGDDTDYSMLRLTTLGPGTWVSQSLIYPNAGNAGDRIVLLVESNGLGFFDSTMLGNLRISTSLAGNTNNDTLTATAVTFMPYGVNYMQTMEFNAAFSFDMVNITMTGDNNPTTTELEVFLTFTDKPLPVNLIYFNGNPDHTGVNLQWAYSGNVALSNFSLERNDGGATWTPLASLSDDPMNSSHSFQFHDSNVSSTNPVYRLTGTDLSGNQVLREQIAVEFDPSAFAGLEETGEFTNVIIWPLPFEDHVTISFDYSREEDIMLLAFNNEGNCVHKQDLHVVQGANEFLIENLSSLAAGHYLFEITGESSSVTLKEIKIN